MYTNHPATLLLATHQSSPQSKSEIYYATKYEISDKIKKSFVLSPQSKSEIYYTTKCQIHLSQKLFRLKRLIAATKTLLSSPSLQNDDPVLFFQAREQLRILERLHTQVTGGGSCQ